MSRLPDWPERLAAYVSSAQRTPFCWGSHDCVTFAAGAMEAVTGARPVMPQWHDVHDALRQLRAVGGLAAAVESAGLPVLTRPEFASRGDIVMVEHAPRPFLAVCLGHVWAAPGAAGLEYGPMSSAARGWKAG